MFDRAKTISTIVLKFGVGIFLFTLVLGIATIGVVRYREHRQEEIQQVLIESAGKSVPEYHSMVFNGAADLRTRYERNQRVKYDLAFRCDDHYRLGDNPVGTISIDFLDENAFSIHRETLSEFVRVCQNSADKTICTGLQSRGEFYLPVQEYIRIRSISVSHNLNLARMSVEKRASIVPVNPAPTQPDTQLDFEQQLDEWDKKAEFIKAGMTYEEMISVAGMPRRRAAVIGFDKNIFDPVKYNYGRNWVYFANQVVSRIKQEDY